MKPEATFLLSAFILMYNWGIGQGNKILFEHLTASDGLSDNYVHCIIQDQTGFMWFGTEDGLNRFDGHTVTVYRADSSQFPDENIDHITALYQHPGGLIWAGTNGGGLFILDPKTEKFTYYYHLSDDPNSLIQNQVLAIEPGRNGNIWLGTQGGLQLAELDGKGFPVNFKTFIYDPQDAHSIPSNYVYCLKEASDGTLWIGSNHHGLMRFFPDEQRFVQFRPQKDDPNSLSSLGVMDIFEDSGKNIWISLWNGGINLYNPDQENFQRFTHDHNRPESISSNNVYDIIEKSPGQLWIATYNSGVSMMNTAEKEGNSYQFEDITFDKIGVDYVRDYQTRCLYADRSGLLWAGTLGGGIKKIYHSRDALGQYHRVPEMLGLSNMEISSILEDRQGELWIGTADRGVFRFKKNIDPEAERWSRIQNIPGSRNLIGSNQITCLFEDKDQNIWIGTKRGLSGYNPRGSEHQWEIFTSDPLNPFSLYNNHVLNITEDNDGRLWVNTVGGMNQFDAETQQFLNKKSRFDLLFSYSELSSIDMFHQFSNGTILLGNTERVRLYYPREEKLVLGWEKFSNFKNQLPGEVMDIFETSGKVSWIATRKGLVRHDEESGFVTDFPGADELSSHTITSVITLKDGNLWMGSQSGLIRFHIESGTLTQYKINNELKSNHICTRTGIEGVEGLIWLGTKNGLYSFNIDQVKTDHQPPPVVISGLRFSSKMVRPHKPVNGQVIMDKHIAFANEITIPYTQNVFSIEFSALSYLLNSKNRYAYRLDDLDKKWNYSDSKHRVVTYGNLSPGSYTFRVKAANSNGVWNREGTSLKIKILSPPWKTGWAYCLYGVIFLFLIYISRKFFIKRIELENELKMEKFKSEQISEINQMKMEFFTNISHDLKTPVTLLISPLEKLIKIPESGNEKLFRMMLRNALKLHKQLQHLLEIGNSYEKNINPEMVEEDMVNVIYQTYLGFSDLAQKRNILYNFKSSVESYQTIFDPNHIETILENLLSNAFKYTPRGRKIEVELDINVSPEEGEFVSIVVRDTGQGIKKEDLPFVFNRYYQAGKSDLPSIKNTGIGLSIVKQLVEFYKGRITVTSHPSIQTEFNVEIPVLKSDTITGNSLLKAPEANPQEPQQMHKKTILVVEDNQDLRNHLNNILSDHYQVLVAPDGMAGFNMARKKIPDLIITDIMMPRLNGIDLCQKIKNDIITSHIPIILLSARTNYEIHKKGLKMGADDYVTKPFRTELLRLKIDNIFESREKLRQKFSENPATHQEDFGFSSPDNDLMKKILLIIEQNMENPAFDVKMLAQEIGMSRSVLYTKLPSLTSLSPNEFIRKIRLNHAAKLLAETNLSVAEVCYSVGFSTPKYFAKCFKDQFGQNPSEYAQIRS